MAWSLCNHGKVNHGNLAIYTCYEFGFSKIPSKKSQVCITKTSCAGLILTTKKYQSHNYNYNNSDVKSEGFGSIAY